MKDWRISDLPSKVNKRAKPACRFRSMCKIDVSAYAVKNLGKDYQYYARERTVRDA